MTTEIAKVNSFVLFELAGTSYAVSCQVVQQIEMVDQVTPVPNAPPFVDGVMFVRGQVIPVINLRARFHLDRVPTDIKTRLLVVTHANRAVGLLVDSARDFVSIGTDAIAPPPEAVTNQSGKVLAGIARIHDRLVLILDVAELLSSQDVLAVTAMS